MLRRKPYREGAFTTFKPKPRKPSKRSADPVTPETYDLLVKRARGRCEYASPRPETGTCRGRVHAHHRLPVQHGGLSTLPNLGMLCAGHHDYMHQHPAMGMKLGWLVDRRKDPTWVSTTLGDGRRVRLTPAGTYEDAP